MTEVQEDEVLTQVTTWKPTQGDSGVMVEVVAVEVGGKQVKSERPAGGEKEGLEEGLEEKGRRKTRTPTKQPKPPKQPKQPKQAPPTPGKDKPRTTEQGESRKEKKHNETNNNAARSLKT